MRESEEKQRFVQSQIPFQCRMKIHEIDSKQLQKKRTKRNVSQKKQFGMNSINAIGHCLIIKLN